jgi:AhpD family alkylhydroperoxidase
MIAIAALTGSARRWLAPALLAMVAASAPARAGETGSAEAAYADIQKTMGFVPSFAKLFPKRGIAGAWAEVKAIELSDDTALPPKMKALISLAVAAQIPCSYCVYADTLSAERAGATEEEIAEAVALSALTRHWSTVFNGMQVDLDTFKKELAADMGK